MSVQVAVSVRVAAGALALLAWSTACATAGKQAAASAAEAAEEKSSRATVGVQFLPDPARIAPDLHEGQDFVPPSPIVTHLPGYPPGHEDASAPVVVVLRFVVGKDGAVRDVRDSPLRDPGDAAGTGRPGADPAFRAAAVDAVLGWLFVPAEIRTVKPGADLDNDSKPDYTVLVHSERVPVYLDVRFTFEMVEGEGRVRID